MADIAPAPTADILALYHAHVPDELDEEIVRCIRDACRTSVDVVDGRYPRDQAREAQPWVRRAELGTALLALSSLFPGLSVTSQRSRGSTYYVPLKIGSFTVLVARATDPNAILPKAAYRTEIATQSAQEELFGPVPVPADAAFYGVILYGGPTTEADPHFIMLRFPTRDHSEYLDEKIDLKERFLHLFRESTPIEEIADESRSLTLRETRETGSSDGA